MFPFYPNATNDPAFFISSANFQQEADDTNTIPQDPVLIDYHHPPQNQVHDFTTGFLPNIITTSNSESNFAPIHEAFGYNHGDNKKEGDQDGKKKMHRDLERLRRKEMNSLYANLRTLIPLENIKGKRSISDQMHEAAKYINHKQATIKELEAKREKLKKMSSWSGVEAETSSGSDDAYILSRLSVRSCLGGVEVVFTSGFDDEDLPLSKVLKALNEDGFEIASCVSTRTNGGTLHTIQSEANDDSQTALDIAGLRRKLTELLI